MNPVSDAQRSIAALRANISRVIIGQPRAVDLLLRCLLARGHALIEDVPGVGKTALAHALAKSVACTFSRIQLTPDTLPADVLGVSIYDRERGDFHFRPGPIFAHIVLADEINRTPPRTQSALLEAMAEATVSLDGLTRALEQPFLLVATQNPHDFEGTYALPENQLDRFLMRFAIGYPSPADEARVLRERPGNGTLHALSPVLTREQLLALQAATDAVAIDDALYDYIVMLARATRVHPAFVHGVSPRGALALAQAARASALLMGRNYVVPEDITENIVPVCAHRVVAKGVGGASVAASALAEVVASVPSPT